MSVKNHTLGECRYLTYELHFQDGEVWRRQTSFFGPLDTWLKLTSFAKKPHVCIDLIQKGECFWRAPTGETHKLTIDTMKRQEKWGRKKGDKGVSS